MNVSDLYRKIKQILNDSNVGLLSKGANEVNSLNDIPSEIEKLEINRLPYLLRQEITEITEDDLAGCTSIRNYFGWYDSITSITVPNSVTTIGNNFLSNCNNLNNISLPDSIISIGERGFINTPYYDNISNWEDDVLYIGKHLIATKSTVGNEYRIKDGTLVIARGACKSIASTSIVIPDSVITIGKYAFSGCNNLTDIYLNSTTPPTLLASNSFPSTIILHIPEGSFNTYKSATNWSYLAGRMVEDIVIE